jgi:hypothetical protein
VAHKVRWYEIRLIFPVYCLLGITRYPFDLEIHTSEPGSVLCDHDGSLVYIFMISTHVFACCIRSRYFQYKLYIDQDIMHLTTNLHRNVMRLNSVCAMPKII